MSYYIKQPLKNYILAALSGLLLALSFPYPSIGIFAWIGFIPLFFALKRSDLKVASLTGFIFGMTFFALVLYWILVFGILAWMALSLLLSLWMILFAAGSWAIMRYYRGAGQLMLIPSLWAICEYGRSLGSWGFAWAYIGSTVDNTDLLQIASYVGESGLGFIIVLFNLLLFQILDKSVSARRLHFSFKDIPALAVIILLLVVAGFTLSRSPDRSGRDSIKMAIIQPNIGQNMKADIANNDDIKSRYLSMTKEALRLKPDLIIWPESAFISYISDEEVYLNRIEKLLISERTSLVLGGLDKIKENVHNGAFYIDHKGARHVYYKMHLVPFGEYMPMRGLVEKLNNMATMVRDLTPGNNPSVFKLSNNRKFSTIICFESSDSALVGMMVRQGARMMVVVTNDAWFGKSAAAEQHFRITRMRAAEYGIPVVQAATTGISGIIDQNGEVISRTRLNEKRILSGSIMLSGEPSLFSRFGYLLPYIYLAMIIIAIRGRTSYSS